MDYRQWIGNRVMRAYVCLYTTTPEHSLFCIACDTVFGREAALKAYARTENQSFNVLQGLWPSRNVNT